MATKTKGPEKKSSKPAPGQTTLQESDTTSSPGDRIRDVAHGFRLSFQGLSRTRTVKAAIQKEIADEYDADADALRTIKKLIPAGHPSVKKLSEATGKINDYFSSRTLPFPENGVRLFPARSLVEAERAKEVETFLDELQKLIGDYYAAAAELDKDWPSVLAQAQREQGQLFDADDYPKSVKETLQCRVYPYNVDIPNYYAKMSTRHYREAQHMLKARFAEAAKMQEQVVAKAMSDAVAQLAESVGGFHSGQQKTFKNSVVENVLAALKEFDEKARNFGIGGDEMAREFDKLHKVLLTDGTGRTIRERDVADELRRDKELAVSVTKQIAAMGEKIAAMASLAPRRVLARRT